MPSPRPCTAPDLAWSPKSQRNVDPGISRRFFLVQTIITAAADESCDLSRSRYSSTPGLQRVAHFPMARWEKRLTDVEEGVVRESCPSPRAAIGSLATGPHPIEGISGAFRTLTKENRETPPLPTRTGPAGGFGGPFWGSG